MLGQNSWYPHKPWPKRPVHNYDCSKLDFQGLGQPEAFRFLNELIRVRRLELVLLFETLVHAQKLENIRVRFNYEGCFSIDIVGHSGRIGVLWKSTA